MKNRNIPLEDAVKSLDQYFIGKFLPKKEMTLLEKAKDQVEKAIMFEHERMIEVSKAHRQITQVIASNLENLSNLKYILLQGAGFVRVDQRTANQLVIINDFTGIEELAGMPHAPIEYFRTRPLPRLGDLIYSVAPNGLLTLVDSKVDSSD